MFFVSLLGWWYGSGWVWLLKGLTDRLKDIKETFSVPTLIKTLFSPWKQIQTVSTFRNFFQSAVDNLISRLVGATIRFFMLIGALIFTFVIIFIGLAALILWPVIPLLLIVLPAMSVIGVELW